jgi:hypothetical protein
MPRHPAGARATAPGDTPQPTAPASEAPAIPGGAAGMPAPLDPYARPPSQRPEEKADEYMVTDGPRNVDGRIRYHDPGSSVVLLPHAKIVTAATHDLAAMRRQGIVLEPMPKEVPVEEDEPEPEAPSE